MDQLRLIARLMEIEPPLYLFGGYAEDALLYGRTSRPHVDVDVFVWAYELPLRIEQAALLGFTDFVVRWESVPNQPLAVGAIANGLDLEFCVAQRSPDGRSFFDFPTPNGLMRTWIAEPVLAPEEQVLDGIRVRTLSPLALYQTRTAVRQVVGEFRPKDATTQAALRERFFGDATEEQLAPSTEIVTDGRPHSS